MVSRSLGAVRIGVTAFMLTALVVTWIVGGLVRDWHESGTAAAAIALVTIVILAATYAVETKELLLANLPRLVVYMIPPGYSLLEMHRHGSASLWFVLWMLALALLLQAITATVVLRSRAVVEPRPDPAGTNHLEPVLYGLRWMAPGFGLLWLTFTVIDVVSRPVRNVTLGLAVSMTFCMGVLAAYIYVRQSIARRRA